MIGIDLDRAMSSEQEALSTLPSRLPTIVRWAIRRSNVVMFVAGFLFDALTIQRIDAWTDLALQLVYLLCLTALLLLQHRESTGHWTPHGLLARAWHYNVELLHFFYGGLL